MENADKDLPQEGRMRWGRIWYNVRVKARGEEMTTEELETLIASGEGETLEVNRLCGDSFPSAISGSTLFETVQPCDFA